MVNSLLLLLPLLSLCQPSQAFVAHSALARAQGAFIGGLQHALPFKPRPSRAQHEPRFLCVFPMGATHSYEKGPLGPMPAPSHDSTIEKLADSIASRAKAVAFDMDQCLVAQHSKGCMPKEDLQGFLQRVTPDFKKLVPELHKRGVRLAIATHSDTHEYNDSVTPATHILGEHLVEAVLEDAVPELRREFFVVAFNPYARFGPMLIFQPAMAGKKHHIREVVKHYALDGPGDVILFDDDETNCRETEGNLTFKVDPKKGFCARDLPESLFVVESGNGT
mmetsp:Transcript_31412/g.76999  ORF Transcript_31412/g.76999 Transcript_31412/m.76999 type:complete len:278 (-) Transcript_31412:245-1078(-)